MTKCTCSFSSKAAVVPLPLFSSTTTTIWVKEFTRTCSSSRSSCKSCRDNYVFTRFFLINKPPKITVHTFCSSICRFMSSSSGPKGCTPILLIRVSVVSSQSESCFSCWCCRSIKTSWSLEMFQNISYMKVVNSKVISMKSDRFIFLAKGLLCKHVTTCSVSPYWPHADVPSESWADSSVPAPPSLHHQSAALQTTTHFLLWEPGPRCPDETLTPPCSPGQT